MLAAGFDRQPLTLRSDHFRRRQTRQGDAIAALPERIAPPAVFPLSVANNYGARVRAVRGEALEVAGQFEWCVAICCGAVAKLTFAVSPPAVSLSRERAG